MGNMIKNWITGNMGNPGNYEYTGIHIYSIVAVLAVTVVILLFGISKKTEQKKKHLLLKAICWFQLGFEVLWRLLYVYVKGDSALCWWPLYPCNLGGVLIPLIGLLNLTVGKKMFYLFGFVGGVLTFAVPDGIFTCDILVFPILKSILQHTGVLIIPLLALVIGDYRPTLKDMGYVVAGLLVHLVNSEGIVRLLGFDGDYMFFRSGMPFVIPGVPQFITLSVFALAVLVLLSYLCDVKGSRDFLTDIVNKDRSK